MLADTKKYCCFKRSSLPFTSVYRLDRAPQQGSCKIFLLHCLVVVTLVKGLEREAVFWLCIPYHERIDHIVVITDYRHIIRHCKHRLIVLLLEMKLSVFICALLHISSKLDLIAVLRTTKLEWISVLEPVVRHLNLEAV